MSTIEVREYRPGDQPGIDAMMERIASEYAEPISGPHSVRIREAYQLPDQRYWVAVDGQRVVGTVGLILLSAGNVVLKRMMIDSDYRGPRTGLANRLLETASQWGRSHAATTMYLGTMAQFGAAQRFYAKHGATEVSLQELPSDMPVNPIDTLHYRIELL